MLPLFLHMHVKLARSDNMVANSQIEEHDDVEVELLET